MSISKKVIRKLWASSGGYCANPNCHADLFPLFENGEVANIEELAHIIGQKKNGPRGNDDLSRTQRDEFDNIIVLCPSCHTLVDKNEKQFPVSIIKEWKNNHEDSIKKLFQTPVFKTCRNNKGIDCIVLIGFFNRYSQSAKSMAGSMGVGLFDLREFYGALNYSGERFIDYEKQNEDKGSNTAM